MLFAAAIIIVPLAIWNGAVISILWGWFIVPLGAPPLTVAHAIGVSLLIGFIRHKEWKRTPQPNMVEVMEKIGVFLMSGPLALVMGYVIKEFMK
jgi:hypothetical protein